VLDLAFAVGAELRAVVEEHLEEADLARGGAEEERGLFGLREGRTPAWQRLGSALFASRYSAASTLPPTQA
jgi:hypothetical protein